ncbi:MAG: hypothetical protein HN403_09205 [Rhodospirillales bacterium]|jgi:lipopolysaccharide export system protein LptA|nr:hypothetical protein [Rhodospirillales bacterium]
MRTGKGRFLGFLAVWFTAAMILPGSGAAQNLDFSSSDSDLPIEVQADDGIEWQQDGQVFLARGNARATRGELSINADLLRAYYRKGAKGGTEISRIDAVGRVKIDSGGENAFGETAVYDVDKSIMVLSGKKVRLVTAQDEITADRQLEYYELKRMAVARGNAVARRADRTLKTEVLVAYFKNDKAGKSRVHRVDAFDDIYIKTVQEEVWAERGVYNVDSGIVTLSGDVRIARDDNKLAGCDAVVDLNTGISKLKSCKGSGKRVRGLLQPSERDRVKKN